MPAGTVSDSELTSDIFPVVIIWLLAVVDEANQILEDCYLFAPFATLIGSFRCDIYRSVVSL